MNQKRNQTKVVNVFTVFMVMLILYFIVGLFTVINQQFQIPLQTAMLPHDGNITNALVTMLNFSWFLAYPLSEGFGTRWLEKYGYRKTSYLALLILIAGLAIYEAAVLFHIYTPMQVSIIGKCPTAAVSYSELIPDGRHFSDRLFCDRCSRNDPASSAQSISHSLPDW